MPICSAYSNISMLHWLVLLQLWYCKLIYLLPTGRNYLISRERLSIYYLTNIVFSLFLNWIHFFVLEFAIVSFGGLVYVRLDTLDITMWYLQVYWEVSKIACLTLLVFVFWEGLFPYPWKYLIIGCSWPSSSTMFGLIQLHPLQYWCDSFNKWTLAPVSVQQWS